MRMRYFQAYYAHTDTQTGNRLLQRGNNAFGKLKQACVQIVVKIEKVIHLFLRNDERMSFRNGKCIEKCEEILRFGDFMARDLPRYNS